MKKEERLKLEEARKNLRRQAEQLVHVTSHVLEPLKTLSDEQLASVAILNMVTRAILQSYAPSANLGKDVLEKFNAELVSVCPVFPPIKLDKYGDPCLEYEINYATAMAKCREDDIDEDDCWEAQGWGARATMCRMEQIEGLKGPIGDIWDRIRPPKPPIPWPE